MRSLPRLLTMTMIIGMVTLQAQQNANWQWLHGTPQGNPLRFVKMWDANNWYMIGHGGTFMKTSDGGSNWYFHNKAGRINSDGYSLDLLDAHFFDLNNGLAVGQGGIMSTTDAGQTWNPVTTTIPDAVILRQIYFETPLIGYVVGSSGSLAKTTDGGLTWVLNSSISSGSFYDIVSWGNTILATANFGDIFRSTDGGTTWTVISTGAIAALHKMYFVSPTVGFCAGSGGTIIKTADGGTTWTVLNPGAPSTTSFHDIDLVGSYIYFTGNSDFIYATSNQGTSFSLVGFLDLQPVSSTYYATDFLSNGDFVTVGNWGLVNSKFGSTSQPVCHTRLRKSGTNFNVWSDQAGAKVIVVGAPSSAGLNDQVMISTNGGTDWTSGNVTTPGIFRGLDMASPLVGYLSGSDAQVHKTTDGGFNWIPCSNIGLLPTDYFYAIDATDLNTVFTVNNTGTVNGTVHKSTDGGVTWATYQISQSPSPADHALYDISMFDGNTGWVISSNKPYKTTDGGLTWLQQSLPDNFNGLLLDIHALSANVAWCVGAFGRVYKTIDGGATWSLIPVPVNNQIGFTSIVAFDDNTAIIGGTYGLTLHTTNGGTTWTQEYTGGAASAASLGIHDLAVPLGSVPGSNPITVFAVGGNSFVFKRPGLFTPVGLAHEIAVPKSFTLHQNFPNPFNPSTTIKYSVSMDNLVSIKVFNTLGSEVATLVNKFHEAGDYAVSFSPSEISGLSSGVYFYILSTGGKSLSRKMIFLK